MTDLDLSVYEAENGKKGIEFLQYFLKRFFLKYISADVFEMAQPCWKVYNLWMNCLEGQAQLNIVGKKYHRTISG